MKITYKVLLALFLAITFSAQSAPTVTVHPSTAPNGFSSPNFGTYVQNAIFAIQNGLAFYGNPLLPDYYQQYSVVDIKQIIVTGFPSWNGDTNPIGAFANEFGSRIHFGLDIRANGSPLSISQLGFSLQDAGLGDLELPGAFPGFGAPGSYQYGARFIGILYVDGIRGNGDDIIINSGPNDQPVDEIIGGGSGNGFEVQNDSGSPGNTLQEKFNNEAGRAMGDGFFNLTGSYYLDTPSGVSGSAVVNVVPEPTALLALICGVAIIGNRRGRKSRVE